MYSPREVNELWFKAPFEPGATIIDKAELWFSESKHFDRTLRRQLFAYTTLAAESALTSWADSAEGSLALCLLLDRIKRSCYRGTTLAYDDDSKARAVALRALERVQDMKLDVIERVFLLFPLAASEKTAHQKVALNKLDAYSYHANSDESVIVANMHELCQRNIMVLDKFARFPHRAHRLGKPMKPSERQFVEASPWQHWL